MPGKWDGRSRPTNDQYRENYDDIFKTKTTRVARSKAIRRSSVRAGSQGVKKKQSSKKDSGTTDGKTLEK